MTIHKILYVPDPRLRQRSKPITKFDNGLQTLVDDMFETMYDASGVGLAGPQIGINKLIAVIDVTKDKHQQLTLINPEIIETRGETKLQEGCLSVPPAGIYEKVLRFEYVKMRALDRDGKPYELEANGLLAQAIQHEVGHLHGQVFIDLLSSLKRNRVMRQVDRFKRQQKS